MILLSSSKLAMIDRRIDKQNNKVATLQKFYIWLAKSKFSEVKDIPATIHQFIPRENEFVIKIVTSPHFQG